MKSFETKPLGHEEDANQGGTGESALPTSEVEVEREEAMPGEQHALVVLGGAGSEEAEATDEPVRRRWSFSPPSREQLLTWLPFWGVILLGAILRFWGLGDKPLHHDESLHAYYGLQLMRNIEHWSWCIVPPASNPGYTCYAYNPLLHGPFQFHVIALVYKISQILGAPDNGINTTTVRIAAATLGTLIVGLPYFLRDYLGKWGAWLAALMLAVSPSMVYFSRFAREDIYFAFFTLVMVVGTARYIRDRKMRWLIIAASGFAFAYATKESIFLMILTFGGFLGALIIWELGIRLELRSRLNNNPTLPKTFAPLFVFIYLVIGGIAAKLLLSGINALSKMIVTPQGTSTPQADQFVANLKQVTLFIIPWLGIALGAFVLIILFREMAGKAPQQGRRGLARKVNPRLQPVLDTLTTMPWTHWFFAIICAWTIFLVLFSVLFTNVANGIGDGIWQGIYYWIQQVQVARGNQPWYYYLMILPLYEQVGLFFGIIGILRCAAKPTRFRIFVVYWFVTNLFIYSWAAEKMPWLTIHMSMPLMLLAGIGLEPAVVTCVNLVKNLFARFTARRAENGAGSSAEALGASSPLPRRKVGVFAESSAVLGVLAALLLLIPTVHNMYEVSYIHAADGPREMLVYVQTTTDVNIVMNKVDALDRTFYGGRHQMPIALTSDATWPFAWYVRDYPNVCFDYPSGCPNWPKNTPVIIAGGDNPYGVEAQYAGSASPSVPGPYTFHQYRMRSWWDEGYKPPPCIPVKAGDCSGQPAWGGVGLPLWLSYGDNPPPNAKFNLSLAMQRIWNWEWYRQAFGDTNGAYDMVLFIRYDLSKTVAP